MTALPVPPCCCNYCYCAPRVPAYRACQPACHSSRMQQGAARPAAHEQRPFTHQRPAIISPTFSTSAQLATALASSLSRVTVVKYLPPSLWNAACSHDLGEAYISYVLYHYSFKRCANRQGCNCDLTGSSHSTSSRAQQMGQLNINKYFE